MGFGKELITKLMKEQYNLNELYYVTFESIYQNSYSLPNRPDLHPIQYMSKVTIDNITITNPKSNIRQPINFLITFTTTNPLYFPLLWKVIYVGSAYTEEHDQILEQFEIQHIEEASTLSFEVNCSPPEFDKIPFQELLCTTAIIISIAYNSQEFIRIGYYIHNCYIGEEEDVSKLSLEQITNNSQRTIIREKPRITKFEIKWHQDTDKQERSKQEKAESNDKNINESKVAKEEEGEQDQRQGQSLQKNQTDA